MKANDIVLELIKQNYTHFDKFYQLTERQVYFSIIAIVKSQEVAKDLMQETYMKFIEKIHQFDTSKNIYAYLTTIARNLSINYYNKAKRDIHDDEIFEYIPSKDRVDEDMWILDIVDTLEQTKKEIVMMHVINDLKFREIADILDMKLGTVLWHYNQAIKELKEKVGDIQ